MPPDFDRHLAIALTISYTTADRKILT